MEQKARIDTFKISIWLQVYPDVSMHNRFVIENFFQKRRFLLEGKSFFSILIFCSLFKSKKEIENYIVKKFKVDKAFANNIFNQLLGNGILVTKHSPEHKAEIKMTTWDRHNWKHAKDYFISIRDYPFLDYESNEARCIDNGLMKEYTEKVKVPPVYKEYKNAKRILLQKDIDVLDKLDLWKLLLEKVFDIESSNLQLSKKQISDILFYTFGRTGTVKFPLQGEFILKTSPSGGARHPIEAYVVLLDSEIGQGVFHYSVKTNSLEKIRNLISTDELNKIIYELRNGPQFKVKAVIIMSAIFERSMWRYREPRSYRVILHDLGHLLETMKIVCRAKYVATYFGDGFMDSQLEKYLELDNSRESVLKFAALG